MASAEENLVGAAQEIRGVSANDLNAAALEEAKAFFQKYEADAARNATHTVLENYPDWWVRARRAPPGLMLETDEALDELYRHAGTLYSMGIPLTLAERRTQNFRLFQDMEAWGSKDAAMVAEDVIGPDFPLAEVLGQIMGEVFPGRPFLDVAIFDSTGLSQTKGLRKTSVRLVWPGLIVDADRAARIRDLVVHKLTSASSSPGPIAELEDKIKGQGPTNAWHSVFGDAAYGNRCSVRLPLNDRVSPLPLRAPEKRPFVPVGVLRFTYPSDAKLTMKMEWLCRGGELEPSEWLKIGCLRQKPDMELSEWSVPAYGTGQVAPVQGARTGRVKVRTAAGSDGGGGLRVSVKREVPVERAGQLLTVERRFQGTVESFCTDMEAHMGKATVEADGTYVWQQPTGDARIVMYQEDKRVKIIGRTNQVRSLMVIVSAFTEAAPTLGPTHRPGAGGAGPALDGRAPSAAYAPNPEADAPGDNPEGGDDNPITQEQVLVAQQEFKAEDDAELALAEGDRVVIVHDPDVDQGQDRWVYGRNTQSGAAGWFPISHTEQLSSTA